MVRRIYFTRHGLVESGKLLEVSPHGMRRLERVRYLLEQEGFRASAGASSTELRAVETSRFLAYDAEPVALEILHAYGGLEDVAIVQRGMRGGIWNNYYVYTDRALRATLAKLPPDADAVVSGHDHIPFMLALRYAQMNGAQVTWNYLPDHPGFPDQGEGVLVSGSQLQYFFEEKEGVG